MGGKSYIICLIGCFTVSIALVIWLYAFDGLVAAGVATYYINGVHVSSSAMVLSMAILTAFLFGVIGSMATSFLAHIPVYVLAHRLRRKLNIAIERRRYIAVLLWLCLGGFSAHLIYLGLLDLCFIRFAILFAGAVFNGFNMLYIGNLMMIITLIWWLFDIVYILQCKEKFYTARIHWIKS
jgi:hypothetical protein